MIGIKDLRGYLDLKKRLAYDLPNENYSRFPIIVILRKILIGYLAFSSIALFMYLGIVVKSVGAIWLNAVYILLLMLFSFTTIDALGTSGKVDAPKIGFTILLVLCSYYWFILLGLN